MYRKACVTTTEEAVASCQVVGYPAMIKASWGGGGKGIRKVCFIYVTRLSVKNCAHCGVWCRELTPLPPSDMIKSISLAGS